jgi:hypothetical protein
VTSVRGDNTSDGKLVSTCRTQPFPVPAFAGCDHEGPTRGLYMTDRAHYRQNASACFNKLADLIAEDAPKAPHELSFWHVGRTLNTCQDYITQNGANVPSDAARFINEVHPNCVKFYHSEAGAPNNQNWWWDDYGWWGLAHLATGDLNNAKDCWLRMNTYGVDTAGPGPDYLGGCWNHQIDQDPAGCENCVTNSTFFLLSLRLLNNASFAEDPLRKSVLTAAQAWRRWFDHWAERPGAIRNPLQLMRERPVGDVRGNFANGAPTYEVGWIWTGDQGLALAWAAEAYRLAPTDWKAIYPDTPDRSSVFQLAGQIRQGMTSLFDVSGVLHEAPYFANSSGSYRIDYCSGRGVFMRYIARADDQFRHQPTWLPSDTHILQTADAVIARLAEGENATMYSWNYPSEQTVLDTWKKKVTGPTEGYPQLCNAARLSPDATSGLVFYGIALDALTAATAVPQS